MTRIARIAAGLVLISGALYLAQNAVAREHGHSSIPSWRIICLTWFMAVIVGFIGSVIRDRSDRHLVAGYVVPAMGVALMVPLSLHLAIAALAGWVRDFDAWCLWSVIFVSVAHVAFAILVGMRAAAIARGREPVKVSTIYIATVALAGVPGVVLVLPMIIVALTGIPIAPLLHAMERWGERATVPVAIARTAA